MNQFNELEFYRFILSNQIFRFGEVVLTSGRKSYFKLDWETVLSNKRSLEYIASCIIAKTEDLQLAPNLFIGVPEGVTSLGVVTQLLWAEKTWQDNLVISRKDNPKYVGNPSHQTIVYLEDVTTTGGSILRELDKAAQNKATVSAVLSLADRGQLILGKTAKNLIESKGATYSSLSMVPNLLVGAYGKGLMTDEVAKKIEAEYSHFKEGWLLGKEFGDHI